MATWLAFFSAMWKFIQDNVSAVALAVFNYEEERVDEAKQEQKLAEVQLQEEQAADQILNKYAGKSSADVIDDVLGSDTDGQDGKKAD